MIVYAKKEGTYIWSDNGSTYKAGRVPVNEPLTVISDSNASWYAIERPANISLPVQPGYPDYWVKKSDTVPEPEVPGWPTPEPIPDPTPDPTPGMVLVERTVTEVWRQQ